jgi:hypothetical protein
MEKTIDGKFSLDELKATITSHEQLGFVKLTDIQKGSANPPVNVATFVDDPSPAGPLPLVLLQLGPNDVASTIIAGQTAQGRSVVFNSSIFVSSTDSKVIGFR